MTTASQGLTWEVESPAPPLTGTRAITWLVWGTEEIQVVLVRAPTGLVGTLTVEIATILGSAVYGPTTAEIVEFPEGTGRYVATVPLPGVGEYYVTWSDGETSVSVLMEVSESLDPVARWDLRPYRRPEGIAA